MLGQSMRDNCNEMVANEDMTPAQANFCMSTIENMMGQATLDEKFDSVPEMREKHRQDAKGARKARRSAKKKKGKGRKKK